MGGGLGKAIQRRVGDTARADQGQLRTGDAMFLRQMGQGAQSLAGVMGDLGQAGGDVLLGQRHSGAFALGMALGARRIDLFL